MVGVLRGRNSLPLNSGPQNVKIISQVCPDSVLKPFLEVNLAKLDLREIFKIVIHDVKTLFRSSKNVVGCATTIHQQLTLTIISNKNIHIKSPDMSPFDFFGFGYLKKRLSIRCATTLDGLWKVARSEWSGNWPKTG